MIIDDEVRMDVSSIAPLLLSLAGGPPDPPLTGGPGHGGCFNPKTLRNPVIFCPGRMLLSPSDAHNDVLTPVFVQKPLS